MNASRSPNDEHRALGQKLFKLRKSLKIKREDCAEFLGISLAQYEKYERGETKIDAVRLDILMKFFAERQHLMTELLQKDEYIPGYLREMDDLDEGALHERSELIQTLYLARELIDKAVALSKKP